MEREVSLADLANRHPELNALFEACDKLEVEEQPDKPKPPSWWQRNRDNLAIALGTGFLFLGLSLWGGQQAVSENTPPLPAPEISTPAQPEVNVGVDPNSP